MEQNQIDQGNETTLFEGQPIEQPQVVNTVETQMFSTNIPVEAVQVQAQQEESVGFVQEVPLSEPFNSMDMPMYQEPQFVQPMQEETFIQQQPMPFAQPQQGNFIPNGLPVKPKSKKKMITIIVSSVVVAVLLILGGLYGYSVYSKTQVVESLRNERNSLKTKNDELKTKVEKLEALDKLQTFETCMNSAKLAHGEAFHVTASSGTLAVSEVTESNLKDEVTRCKSDVADLSFDGLKEVVENSVKKMEEGYKANAQYTEEAKTIASQWNEFYNAWKTGPSTSYINEAEFNRLRDLAAKAMGVDPASVGSDSLSYYKIATTVYARIRTVEQKQKSVTITEAGDFISKNRDGELGDIKSAFEKKQDEQQEVKKKLDQKEKEIKDKESKVWNPFQ